MKTVNNFTLEFRPSVIYINKIIYDRYRLVHRWVLLKKK